MTGERLARVIYEVHADQAAFQARERVLHVIAFHAAKDPLVTATRVEFLAEGASPRLPRYELRVAAVDTDRLTMKVGSCNGLGTTD